MMHAGLKEALTVQAHPEPNSSKFGRGRKLLSREINLRFFRHQIHIGEDDDTGDRLFRDLSAPAGFGTGVVALALLETELQQEFNQVHEMFARTAERMVIMISPAETKAVLAALLNLSGAIPFFPI